MKSFILRSLLPLLGPRALGIRTVPRNRVSLVQYFLACSHFAAFALFAAYIGKCAICKNMLILLMRYLIIRLTLLTKSRTR
eukprot:UN02196